MQISASCSAPDSGIASSESAGQVKEVHTCMRTIHTQSRSKSQLKEVHTRTYRHTQSTFFAFLNTGCIS